jgi:hypothetical protein
MANSDRLRRWTGPGLTAALLRWHRRVGLASFAVIAIMAVSGLLLNHARTLGLHEIDVDTRFVPGRYGQTIDAPIRAFHAGGRWAVWLSRRVIVDGRIVGSDVGPVVGARAAGPVLVVAAERGLLLIGPKGQVIESLGAVALPGPVERVGTDGSGRIVIDTGKGLFRADDQLLSWSPTSTAAAWSQLSNPPSAVVRAARAAVSARGPSLERLVLEVHTGRIFGPWGIYLFDAAALCLIVLAATGAVNALKRGRARSKGEESS